MMQKRHSLWWEGSPGRYEVYLATAHQYVSHVLGLVKSYWPHMILDLLGEGMKSDCSEEQFEEFLVEVSPIANRIVSSLESA